MKIWIDAQLPPTLANWLTETFGLEASALRDLALRDAQDMEIFEAAQKLWQPLANRLIIPQDEADYQRLVEWLDQLIDEVGENEQHPLASLMDILGVLIEHYENDHIPELQDL
jgi:HTH-type transcriptional regulator/antitoxin HigA